MIRHILRKYFHLPVLYKDEIALAFRDSTIPTLHLPKMEEYNANYLFVLALTIILAGDTEEHINIINEIHTASEKIFKEKDE